MKLIGTVSSVNGSIDLYEMLTLDDLKIFTRFPDKLYKNNKSYVPSMLSSELDDLNRDKNPAFEYCSARYFMAYRGKKPVGRVAAIHNKRFNETWNVSCIRFSRYDVIDDIDVSAALLGQVQLWAHDLGLKEIQGPMGFCDLDQQGLLIDGFDERGLFITRYNFPYYAKHLEELGFVKKVDWVEEEIKVPEVLDPRIKKISDYVLKRYKYHKLQVKKTREILPYADEIFDLLYNAYSDIYGVIPLTKKQTELYIGQFIDLVSPDFLTLIADENGHLVSFAVVMPSLAKACRAARGKMLPFGWMHLLRWKTRKNHEYLEFMLIGTRKDAWGQGVDAAIMVSMFEGAKKHNIKFAETGPMLESNNRIQATWKSFEFRQHKKRRCYVKEVEEIIE